MKDEHLLRHLGVNILVLSAEIVMVGKPRRACRQNRHGRYRLSFRKCNSMCWVVELSRETSSSVIDGDGKPRWRWPTLSPAFLLTNRNGDDRARDPTVRMLYRAKCTSGHRSGQHATKPEDSMFVAHRDAEHYRSSIWWRVLLRIAIVLQRLSVS
jgi:hypothetical protein